MKYSIPKKNYIDFRNGSKYHYHFIIKELAEEFKKQITCLGENTEPLQFHKKKKLEELIKMEKQLQKIYLTDYKLLIAHNLWQA